MAWSCLPYELYTNMKYLQQSMLKKMDLTHFDSWATAFGEKVTSMELLPESKGFRSRTRFAKFFNLPELMNLWKQVTDIQTADMLNLPVPNVENTTVVTKPSEIQQEILTDFGDRADQVRAKLVNPKEDNLLKITIEGRKMALDQRVLNSLLPDESDTKVNAIVGNVHKIWEESTPIKGTQLIFCDLSTPNGKKDFNIYDDMKQKLIAKGIPEKEVAFIHDANTDKQKSALFSKVRSGKVRVLLGSTQKCGAGTNVQDLLVALHHADCPWRPSDLEQREGRIVRQGNNNEDVKIFKYVTESTFDAYNWATIEAKQKFIGQIFTSKSPSRSCDDVDDLALSAAEVKALATGDPRIKEKMELDVEVTKLKSMRSSHESECHDFQDLVRTTIPLQLQTLDIQIKGLETDQTTLQANPLGENNFKMVVDGTIHTERVDAGEAILNLCKSLESKEDRISVGEFRGFEMEIYLKGSNIQLDVKGELTQSITLSDSPQGCISKINNVLEQIPNKLEQYQQQKVKLHTDLESANSMMNVPFPREAELSEKIVKLNRLNRELEKRTELPSEEKPKEKKESVLGKLNELKQEGKQKKDGEPPKIKGKDDVTI